MLGFLNICKPIGVTSHDVIGTVRKAAKMKHVGHGGTLDPLATGVLPVALGSACRLLRYLPGDKVYCAEILLGKQTDTDDIEGKVLAEHGSESLPDEAHLRQCLKQFIGALDQVPPMYSAVHHQGERLYAMARAGRTVEAIPSRKVHVHDLQFLAYMPPLLTVRIACGAGTYIRYIARDLGEMLGCGGCLQSLVREQAGAFDINSSLSLPDLRCAADEGKLSQWLISPAQALSSNNQSVVLPYDAEITRRISQGQKLAIESLPDSMRCLLSRAQDEHKLILAQKDDDLIAVCRIERTAEGPDLLRAEVVIPDATQT
ncbi:MAG: tRNA pseudouridine(55) synthase TruB [Terriglobales bacterium]